MEPYQRNSPSAYPVLLRTGFSSWCDGTKDKQFVPFGEARWKIQGEAIKSREMYFATYRAIAKDERRPGLYRDYNADFFDLIVVDECHRGSAKDESNGEKS